MENLTLEQMEFIVRWYRIASGEAGMSVPEDDLYEKILQAIADKEFEEKRLQF